MAAAATMTPHLVLEISPNLNFEEVMQEMEIAKQQQARLDQQLDGFLARRDQLYRDLNTVSASPIPEMSKLTVEAKRINAKVAQSSIAAKALSSKVRELDRAQTRVEDALQRVEQVLTLKRTIQTVDKALEARNYEMAAHNAYLVVQQHSQHTAQAKDEVSDVLRNLQAKVRGVVLMACEEAQSVEDLEKVLRFCTLFPLVGLPFRGLHIYCQVQRTKLANSLDAKGLSLKSQPAGAVIAFVELLSKILDQFALCIKGNWRILQEKFCPGSQLRLLQELQGECDTQVRELLRRFLHSKAVLQLVSKVKEKHAQRGHARENSQPQDAGVSIDPRQLDPLLEELAFVIREVQVFDINIRTMAAKATQQLQEEQKGAAGGHAIGILNGMQRDSAGAALVKRTKVDDVVEEVVGGYILLEEFFMLQSIRKAVAIDEHTDESEEASESSTHSTNSHHGLDQGFFSTKLGSRFQTSLTSTMVDDVFYILKKCTERGLSACSSNAASNVVVQVNNVLNAEYIPANTHHIKVWRRLHGGTTGAAGRAQMALAGALFAGGGTSSGSSVDPKKLQADERFLVALNNLEMSGQHVLTLKQHLAREFAAVFSNAEAPRLDGLQETAKLCSEGLRKGGRLLVDALWPRLKSTLDIMASLSYELTEKGYAERDINDPFVHHLTGVAEQELTPLEACLTENNFSMVLGGLVQSLVKRIESEVMKKTFTFWGGLQLDKDIRQLSSFFSRMSNSTVRDKFARLIQISSILQLDKAGEILDYWDDDAEVWRSGLSESEVRRVLGLRTEFSKREIMSLKLT